MRHRNLKEIPCLCCGEKTLRWARDESYMPDITFIWITCDTCDFEFGAGWNKTSRESLLSDFECYLKDLNNDK